MKNTQQSNFESLVGEVVTDDIVYDVALLGYTAAIYTLASRPVSSCAGEEQTARNIAAFIDVGAEWHRFSGQSRR